MKRVSVALVCMLAADFGLLALAPALAQGIQRIAPEHIDHYWIVDVSHVDVTLPYTGVNIDKPGCVAVSFVIGSDGNTHDVRAARVVPPSDLGPAAVSMIHSYEYRPAAGNTTRMPIATYLIVPFNLPTMQAGMPAAARQQVAADRTRHLEPCVLPGYAPPR